MIIWDNAVADESALLAERSRHIVIYMHHATVDP